jgi:3-amino-4-hydroxybenzoic acid synthase
MERLATSTGNDAAQAPIALAARAPTPIRKPARPVGFAAHGQDQLLWYDSQALAPLRPPARAAAVRRVMESDLNGIVLYADNLKELGNLYSATVRRVLVLDNLAQWADVQASIAPSAARGRIDVGAIASADPAVLALARAAGYPTCLRTRIDDAESLHAALRSGSRHPYMLVSFRDATNIGLELAMAELARSSTVLLKETGADIGDAVTTLGVTGQAGGVVVAFGTTPEFDAFFAKLDARKGSKSEHKQLADKWRH